MVRRRVLITGRVQGVGFRFSAEAQATRLGVAGRATNRPDGSLEVEIEGDDDAVAQMLEWLHHGPPSARVDHVEVTDLAPGGATGFEITHPAR